MSDTPVSRRGVYKDLNLSPYEYKSPYGDSFKFASQKKLDMYARDVEKELERVFAFVDRLELDEELPVEIVQLLRRATYKAFYRKFSKR